MKRTAMGLLVVVLLLVAAGLCASAASAGGSGAIIKDASDGVVDGSYSAAQVRAALAVVRSDPAYLQYSDIEGVLVEYLASLTGTTVSDPTQEPDAGGATPGQEATRGGDPAAPKDANRDGKADDGDAPADGGAATADGGDATAQGGNAAADGHAVPGVTALSRAKVRLAAVPWFFAAAAVVLVAGAALLRRGRAT